jgi:hypothetical protein
LGAEFELLAGYQRRAVAAPGILQEFKDEPNDFDNLDEELTGLSVPLPISTTTSETPTEATNTIAPERRPLLLPSTCLPKEHSLSKMELHLRKDQANRYVMALREVIAEKSFQYTHIVRVAPRKSVITRARNTIIKLNFKIAFYCKVYSRCRAALIRLAADVDTLKKFQTLTREDVKASGAMVDPNSPGSSTLSLSWIWQISTSGNHSPANLRECKKRPFHLYFEIFRN